MFWVLGAVLVLSLGGLLGEHLFSSAGLNPTSTTTTTPPTPRAPCGGSGADPAPTSLRSVRAPLAAFMGLSTPRLRPAPAFTLPDQTGQPITVLHNRRESVVLTFFDAPCNDICPVLASEIEQADADLGAQAAQVEFVTVNTDPAGLAASAEDPVLSRHRPRALANWHMLTGPLATLNAIWKDYGVSISVDTKTGLEAHNDVMVFIEPGRPALPGHSLRRRELGRGVQLARGRRWRGGARASRPTPRSCSTSDVTATDAASAAGARAPLLAAPPRSGHRGSSSW